MIGGFQPLVFQPAYQQADGTPAIGIMPVGGWIDLPTGKRRTKKQVQEEREQWGILPKKAKNLIIRVAAQQIEELDNTDALIAAFDRAELAYKAQYAELYRREIERRLALMREEEEFLMLH